MKKLLTAALAVLALNAACATPDEEPIPVASTTATVAPLVRRSAPLLPHNPDKIYRVMPLGDSLTKGFGDDDYNGYRKYLKDHLYSQGFKTNFVGSQEWGNMSDPDNEGHGGWTINQMRNYAQDWITEYNPDIVILTAGTNDMGQNIDVANAHLRLSELIKEMKQVKPNLVVFVAKIPGMLSEAHQANANIFNSKIPSMPALTLSFVYLVDQSKVDGLAMWNSSHPNVWGYAQMAHNTYVQIRRVYGGDAWWAGYNPLNWPEAKMCFASGTGADLHSICYNYTRTVSSTGTVTWVRGERVDP